MNENVINDKIYLIGFMAAGKSTIGPILANTLGWDFLDLDKEIEIETGMTVSEIFSSKGEDFFRQKETEMLRALSMRNNIVISLGGGTVAFNDNMKLIKQTGKVVYLKVSNDTLFRRLKNKTNRPVLLPPDDAINPHDFIRQKINDLLKQRSPLYEQADLIINTDEFPLGIIVDKIAVSIYRRKNGKNQGIKGRKKL